MSKHHAALSQKRWLQVRRQVLDRDGWRCAECSAYGNELDHIQPIDKGGAVWDLSNLQVLCRGLSHSQNC